jgi:hypothetical protein
MRRSGSTPRTSLGSVGTGAGGGMLLVVVASSLSTTSAARPYLIWAAPAFSVMLTDISYRIHRVCDTYLDRRTSTAAYLRARLEIEAMLDRSGLSAHQRTWLSDILDQMERARAASLLAGLDLGERSRPDAVPTSEPTQSFIDNRDAA